MADIRPEVIESFQFQGTYTEGIPYGSGHINDTFCVTFEENGIPRRYILQRMNKTIFLNPEELMENVTGVTKWLRKKILEKGGNPERETLNLVPTKEGNNFFVDQTGNYWRAYIFIEGAATYDLVQNKEDFYQSAVAFGHFQGLLADYPAQTLHETIVNFHNTIDRFAKFKKAVEEDVMGRAKDVQEEIQFVLDREALAHTLCDMQSEGKLPLRVTHTETN